MSPFQVSSAKLVNSQTASDMANQHLLSKTMGEVSHVTIGHPLPSPVEAESMKKRAVKAAKIAESNLQAGLAGFPICQTIGRLGNLLFSNVFYMRLISLKSAC